VLGVPDLPELTRTSRRLTLRAYGHGKAHRQDSGDRHAPERPQAHV